jgi:hypothetical protein
VRWLNQDLFLIWLKLIFHPCHTKIFCFQKLVRHFSFRVPKDTTRRTHLSTLINIPLAEVVRSSPLINLTYARHCTQPTGSLSISRPFLLFMFCSICPFLLFLTREKALAKSLIVNTIILFMPCITFKLMVYVWNNRQSTYYDMIYLLTAIGLTPGGSCTVHIYTQTT